MDRILLYITDNWMQWLSALSGLIMGYIIKRLKQQKKESDAVSRGVQSLLRENIVANFNKYKDRGYCPIYAKESLSHIYEAYHNLGGNDVGSRLYHSLMEMPEEKEEFDGKEKEEHDE